MRHEFAAGSGTAVGTLPLEAAGAREPAAAAVGAPLAPAAPPLSASGARAPPVAVGVPLAPAAPLLVLGELRPGSVELPAPAPAVTVRPVPAAAPSMRLARGELQLMASKSETQSSAERAIEREVGRAVWFIGALTRGECTTTGRLRGFVERPVFHECSGRAKPVSAFCAAARRPLGDHICRALTWLRPMAIASKLLGKALSVALGITHGFVARRAHVLPDREQAARGLGGACDRARPPAQRASRAHDGYAHHRLSNQTLICFAGNASSKGSPRTLPRGHAVSIAARAEASSSGLAENSANRSRPGRASARCPRATDASHPQRASSGK